MRRARFGWWKARGWCTMGMEGKCDWRWKFFSFFGKIILLLQLHACSKRCRYMMCVVARGRRTNKEKFQFNFSFSCWLTVQKWRSIHSLTLCWLSCREWWKMRIIFLMFLRDDDDDGWRLKVEHNDNVDSRQWWWTFYYISSSWRKTKKRITKAHHFSSFSTATYIRPRVVSLCSSPVSAHTKCIRKKIRKYLISRPRLARCRRVKSHFIFL